MTTVASPRPRAPADVLDSRTGWRTRFRFRDVLFRGYLVALFGPVAFLLVRDVVAGFAALLGAPFPLTAPTAATTVTAALTAASGVALAAVVHTGVWRGPFSFDRADVTWLLASPLPRRALLRPRLVAAALRSAVWGAAVGATAGSGTAAAVGGAPLPAAAAAATGGCCLALLGLAGAWWPVLHPRHATGVLRAATVTGGVVATLAGVVVAVPSLAPLLSWTAPWGWVATATVSAATGDVVAAVGLLGLSVLVACAALGAALASAGRARAEGLARTTGAAAGTAAAAFMLDFAAIAEVRREALDTLRPSPRLGLPPPRRPALAIAWRDATSILRAPGRALAALAYVAVGALLATVGIDAAGSEAVLRAPVLIAVGAALAQVAADLLVAPLRSALGRPFGHNHLPWSHRALVRRHVVVPTIVLTVGGALAAGAAAAVAGAPDPPVLALGAALTAPVLVLAAALPALRPPRAPSEVAESVLANEYGAFAFALRSWHRLPAPVGITVALTVLARVAPPPLTVLAIGVAGAAVATAIAWWRLSRKAAPWA